MLVLWWFSVGFTLVLRWFYGGFSWSSTLLEGVNSADQPLDLVPLLVMSSDVLPNSRDSEDQKRENPWKSSERIYWICMCIYICIYIYILYIYIHTYIYIYIWLLVKIQVLLLVVFIWFNQLHVDSPRATGNWAAHQTVVWSLRIFVLSNLTRKRELYGQMARFTSLLSPSLDHLVCRWPTSKSNKLRQQKESVSESC